MGQVRCLHCAGVMVETEETVPSDRKSKATPRPRKTCELEMEDDEAFYRCPYCRARNIVAETRGESGFPHLVIVKVSLT